MTDKTLVESGLMSTSAKVDLQNKYVTTREVAEVLGVGDSTVKRALSKLGAVLGEVLKNKQGGYLFTQEQVTLIKQEIQKHHNLENRQIDKVSTELELIENYKKANEQLLQYLNQKKTELEIELQSTKTQVEQLAPKAKRLDDFIGCRNFMNIRDSANFIGVKEKEFVKFLVGTNYIYKNAKGEYRYKADSSKYFSYRPFVYKCSDGVLRSGQQVLLTMEGVEHFKKVLIPTSPEVTQ